MNQAYHSYYETLGIDRCLVSSKGSVQQHSSNHHYSSIVSKVPLTFIEYAIYYWGWFALTRGS